MPTYYVEDYDGERDEPVEAKQVKPEAVEDKAVKPATTTTKRAAKKS